MLLWTCRDAPLGIAAVDDYSFLNRLAFRHPLDPFDSMGASYYWRPLSRQLYFSLVGPWLLHAPWALVLLHASLLLATYAVIFSTARRGFAPPVAAAIAAFPLASESSRLLLGWASGGQHLLAMLFAALAIERALAGKRVAAALAALAGVLSHESAALALPALPMIAWLRTRDRRETAIGCGLAALITVLWAVGYRVALAHGVLLPHSGHGFPFGRLLALYGHAIPAALNLEDLMPGVAATLWFAYGALLVLAVAFGARRAARKRVAALAPAIAGGGLWFALGALPLVALLPDWNAWRDSVASLGAGLAVGALLGAASAALAPSFILIRLTALLLAPVAPAVVTGNAPHTDSDISFVKLTRLQRTLESTRRALTGRYATLPHHAAVRFWLIPALTEVGFEGPNAVRVWYRDSTLSWGPFGGLKGLLQAPDAVVEYNAFERSPATVIESRAIMLFKRGAEAMIAGELDRADSLLTASMAAQPNYSGPLFGSLARNRARIAFRQGHYSRADSLNQIDRRCTGESSSFWAMAAWLAWTRGDSIQAESALRRCVILEPGNDEARQLAQEFGLIPKPTP